MKLINVAPSALIAFLKGKRIKSIPNEFITKSGKKFIGEDKGSYIVAKLNVQ